MGVCYLITFDSSSSLSVFRSLTKFIFLCSFFVSLSVFFICHKSDAPYSYLLFLSFFSFFTCQIETEWRIAAKDVDVVVVVFVVGVGVVVAVVVVVVVVAVDVDAIFPLISISLFTFSLKSCHILLVSVKTFFASWSNTHREKKKLWVKSCVSRFITI